MNRDGLEVRLDNELIWHVKYLKTAEMGNRNSPYRSAPVPQGAQIIGPDRE
jgi:hypothetical protein